METKACQNCRTNFEIAPEDFVFYEKMQVPPPTWCPECRAQRRLAHRNERNFFNRKCDLCHKDMIAMYDADAAFPVYCQECWWSDKWDATSFGVEYDPNKTFFEQNHKL
ncbi:hypothetical protein HY224_02875, partial [Candidatus Uhrbacteria bacterium]|nr:hypothetical protein [Candidatus Uhrbacteria bacterium]